MTSIGLGKRIPSGKSFPGMKHLTLVFLLVALAAPLRADILANSSFVDGRAHWKGDAKEINTSDLSAGNVPGVTVTLNRDKWTKIYQRFKTHEKTVNYSISFT